jgi:hypothetical protein
MAPDSLKTVGANNNRDLWQPAPASGVSRDGESSNGSQRSVADDQGGRERPPRRTDYLRTANTVVGAKASYGGVSTGKVVRSTTRVVSAKFIAPIISYGTNPQATAGSSV